MTNNGILWGVGVGPGDPELMTLKAVRVMNGADTVFAAANERNDGSLALEIARPHLRGNANVVSLPFPHTFDSVDGRAPHRDAAKTVLKALEDGKSAAFLTLGDPMTYSTFSYVMEAVKAENPDQEVRVVPGVTSFAAAAAAALLPLAEGDETLAIVGASRSTSKLKLALKLADSLVVMKPYRNARMVCDLADEAGLGEDLLLCAECSRPTEQVVRGTKKALENLGRYMSLFLIRRGKGLGEKAQ